MKKLILVLLVFIAVSSYSQTIIRKYGDYLKIGSAWVNVDNTTFYAIGDNLAYKAGKAYITVDTYDNIITNDSVGFTSIDELMQHVVSLTKPRPYNYSIALSEIHGESTIYKFGRNIEVGTTEEVIWDGGGAYSFINTADYMEVFSSNANDSLNGSAAWNVYIFGLDSAFNEVSELLDLDGTTQVTTTNKYLRVFRSFVYKAGTITTTNGNNTGDITIQKATGDTIQAKILAGNGQTLMCVYTVPAGKSALITGYSLGTGQGKELVFRSKYRSCSTANCAFATKDIREIYQNTFIGNLVTPLLIPAKTDIVITGIAGTGTVSASASFGLILIDD